MLVFGFEIRLADPNVFELLKLTANLKLKFGSDLFQLSSLIMNIKYMQTTLSLIWIIRFLETIKIQRLMNDDMPSKINSLIIGYFDMTTSDEKR